MTTLELKAQILQEIDKEQDTAILKKLQAYYHKLKGAGKKMPCQYTLEELNKHLDEGEIEAENGGGTEHEEFMKEIEKSWF